MDEKINVLRFTGDSFKAEQIPENQFKNFLEKVCFESSLTILFLIHLGIQEIPFIAQKLGIEVADIFERCDFLQERGIIQKVENNKIIVVEAHLEYIREVLKQYRIIA